MKSLIVTRKKLFVSVCCLLAVIFAVAATWKEAAVIHTTTSKYLNPICSVKTDEKKVAISFDTAWGDEETPRLIEILKRYGVKASFFVVGAWAEKYPQSIKSIYAAGHEVGNHSDTHPHMPKLGRTDMLAQITRCNDKIKNITGISPVLFRPPYGDCNGAIIEATDSVNMYCVKWNIDSFDWKNPTPKQIAERVTTQVKPGSIVLFHNGALNTAAALPDILSTLQAQDYSIVPVSQLIYKDHYMVDDAGIQIKN